MSNTIEYPGLHRYPCGCVGIQLAPPAPDHGGGSSVLSLVLSTCDNNGEPDDDLGLNVRHLYFHRPFVHEEEKPVPLSEVERIALYARYNRLLNAGIAAEQFFAVMRRD